MKIKKISDEWKYSCLKQFHKIIHWTFRSTQQWADTIKNRWKNFYLTDINISTSVNSLKNQIFWRPNGEKLHSNTEGHRILVHCIYRCVLSITTQIGLPAKFDTLAIVSNFLPESWKLLVYIHSDESNRDIICDEHYTVQVYKGSVQSTMHHCSA